MTWCKRHSALALSSSCLNLGGLYTIGFVYLYCLPCKYSSCGAALEAPGLVQLDLTFVVLQSNASCHT